MKPADENAKAPPHGWGFAFRVPAVGLEPTTQGL